MTLGRTLPASGKTGRRRSRARRSLRSGRPRSSPRRTDTFPPPRRRTSNFWEGAATRYRGARAQPASELLRARDRLACEAHRHAVGGPDDGDEGVGGPPRLGRQARSKGGQPPGRRALGRRAHGSRGCTARRSACPRIGSGRLRFTDPAPSRKRHAMGTETVADECSHFHHDRPQA